MKKALLLASLAFTLIVSSCTKNSTGVTNNGGNGGGSSLNVTTTAAYDITKFGFKTGGVLTNYTTQNIIEVGICVSTSSNPSYSNLANTEVYPSTLDDNQFTNYIDCSPGTTYYYRAYVVYGEENHPQIKQGAIKNLTTPGESSPIQVTTYYGGIDYYYGYNGYGYYLYTGGRVSILSGNSVISQKGICYSKYNHTPDINDYTFSCGGNAGEFSAEIGTLSYGATYYYRAYAIYDNGRVAYGATYNASTGSKTGSY